MSFLASWYLWALLLAALPLLIHWLARRRRDIAWAAMTILAQVMARTKRRAQLRDMIILTLRVLALVAVVLAFARPGRQTGGDIGANVVAVVIDASASMQYRIGAESRLDRAKSKAQSAIAALPPDARVALIVHPALTIDGKVGAAVGELSQDRVAINAAIERITAGNAAFDPAAALAAAARSLRTGIGSRSVWLISDMQAGDWSVQAQAGIAQSANALSTLEPRPTVRLIDAGDGETADVAVVSVNVLDPLPIAGAEVPVRAVIQARGGAASSPSPLTVDLYLASSADPTLRKVDSRVVGRIDGTATVDFTATVPSGNVVFEARIQADRLPATDSGRCVVEVVERLEVLVVDGKGATDGFTGASPFLAAALSPSGELSAFRATRITPVQLSPSRIRSVRVIALADVPDLSSPTAEALTSWVHQGGVLLMFMGENVQVQAWNRLFAGMLPVLLDRALELPGQGAGLEPVGAHPLLQPFVEEIYAPLLTRPRVRAMMTATVISSEADQPKPEVIATIQGKPAIVSRNVGRGRVWWYAMSADRTWSDLCLQPAFLPLVQRAVQLGVAGAAPRTCTAGEVAMFEGGAERIGIASTVTAPDGLTSVRTWEALPGGDRTRLDVPGTLLAGVYRIGEATAANRLLAVDTPLPEGDLTVIEPRVIAQRLSGLSVSTAGSGSSDMRNHDLVLSWWLLAIALLCLACETMLAALWAPRDAEDEAPEVLRANRIRS